MISRRVATWQVPAVAIGAALCLPGVAHAHVKWFCGIIDGSIPPLPVGEVLTPVFWLALAAFTAMVAAGALLDALLARALPGTAAKLDTAGVAGDVILRLGVCAYAISLCLRLATVPWAGEVSGSILTPELLDRQRIAGGIQLAIAATVLIPRLSIVAAAGIVALYVLAALQYGAFYMIDYVFFLGLAGYIALGDPWVARRTRFASWRVPLLTAGISFSLMWTAIEKFLFPQWTISVLVTHPGLTMGQAYTTVATIAGFVEFSLAFYLLVGREVLVRVAAVALMIVFTLAMPEFGMLDVIGHIPVVAILLVVVLHGETRLQRVFRGCGPGLVESASKGGSIYLALLFGLGLLFYGLHAVSNWS